MSTTEDRRFWQETEQLLSRNEPRETREEREDREFLERLDDLEFERAADRVEELSADWTDWRGLPLEGFESPRFLTERQREYIAWHRSRCEAFERSVLSPVPYVLRHTFASNALAAGVGTFELARVMGTSLEMIERTYGHLVRGADDAFRSRLEAFAAERGGVEVASASEGQG